MLTFHPDWIGKAALSLAALACWLAIQFGFFMLVLIGAHWLNDGSTPTREAVFLGGSLLLGGRAGNAIVSALYGWLYPSIMATERLRFGVWRDDDTARELATT